LSASVSKIDSLAKLLEEREQYLALLKVSLGVLFLFLTLSQSLLLMWYYFQEAEISATSLKESFEQKENDLKQQLLEFEEKLSEYMERVRHGRSFSLKMT
jgi:hypothetical protein